MEASELRIGNYIEQGIVKAIKIEGVVTNYHYIAVPELMHGIGAMKAQLVETIFSFEDCKPTPLTEEWLLKFGFDKKEGFELKINQFDLIWFYKGKYYLCPYEACNENQCVELQIKYVHQLQNLYFALTGEELTIKN